MVNLFLWETKSGVTEASVNVIKNGGIQQLCQEQRISCYYYLIF